MIFTKNFNYYYTPCGFFLLVLADGLSLGFECLQVSSGLQDPSLYSVRSQQCFSLGISIHLQSFGYRLWLILLIIFYSFEGFSHQHQLKVFHWSLSDSKSPQVFRTLLNILADLSNAVVWILSTSTLISNSSNPFTITSLVTVSSAPITIGITVIFMFHSLFFFQFSSKVQVLISLFAFL